MKKPKASTYSIAMSQETGAIVMVRTNGTKVTVIGALSREDSINFVKDIMTWTSKVVRDDGPRLQLIN